MLPQPIPFYTWQIPAGFPSPAEDHFETVLSLDAELIARPASTFLVRVRGTSMRDVHIDDGDVLVVDRSIRPRHGDCVVAVLDGALTVKLLHNRNNQVRLVPANPSFASIDVQPDQEFQIWGVVTSAIRRFRRAVG